MYPDDSQHHSKSSGPGLEFVSGQAMDVIGAERFLQVQGHAFYGSVFAHSDKTTCGFLKEEKLYLLPYYDLYKLKGNLESIYSKDLQIVRDKSEKKYKQVLREIQNDFENYYRKVKK